MSEYKSKLESKQMDYLCKAILSLETTEECYRFFEDIFTINELKSIEQRLQVAKMLKQKKTYTEIAKETGASTATISRVNRCLNYGSDGYNVVLERIKWE
ncbi:MULTISPECIES: YerC/YecD family TrpR-related protein [Clostridium]|uniref:Trp operon repressor n=1 Tax=Clostridium novyi (strain NT) TaxID=386415 RepID=A0Q2Q5_CLONN|nr:MULTISPECIES: YerC/YecD family TrpR-related protein [Clostridium]ABK62451.1 trp operon repressor [Clostridium novyi NT]KEH85767.1 TrpR-like protein YerC/YecD [Clostridium novyi A str. NCTC 538]KEH89713.1 TrpR-like protein YerC/YecD [Clostridium novyi A str. 4540]KEH90850.1 TrpR-like protein YerC/YecD [Clostridium novyi A str. BKT29909]KEH92644.1 TrpR-like protein YerC/YecD [Clostridium novyi A str. GD211209]